MTSEQVISVLAKVSRKKPHEIEAHVSLASLGLSSSFGLSAVRSLIEAQGAPRLPPLTMRMTVSHIIDLATGAAAEERLRAAAPTVVAADIVQAVQPPQPAVGREMLRGFGLGMDMQEIDTMPIVADYREDAFYVAHFHPSEIATAALRADIRTHLCGIFCAKEAAKKSHPALLDLRMLDLLVVHDDVGRPALQVVASDGLDTTYDFLLSITHTERYAAATCIVMAV